MNWYAIYTKPRQEQRALQNLDRQGFECYLPVLRVQKIVRGGLCVSEEPLFPRYLFIRLDPSGSGTCWNGIRSTRGVTRLVTFGLEPAIVSEALIDAIRGRDSGEFIQPLFKQGQRVRVTSGPFAGIDGLYEMANGERRALVLIELLRQPTKLPVLLRQLEEVGE